MKILITGASGLLGGALAQRYLEQGHELWCWLHRKPLPEDMSRLVRIVRENDELSGHFDLVVNLAGASVAAGPWTERRRHVIRQSRIDFTHDLLSGVDQGRYSVGHLISGSAVGYYGSSPRPVTEQSPPGRGFGASFVSDWEAAAQAYKAIIPRITLLRTGLVLSRKGGLLPQLARPARFGLATRLGNGRQGLSWVHLRDWLNAIDWITDHQLTGPVNLTAPKPVCQDDFNRLLARVLNRPYFFRVPGAPVKMALGEMSSLLLEGQYALPERLQDSGFKFQFDRLELALEQLLKQ